jgi:hypothetical protein
VANSSSATARSRAFPAAARSASAFFGAAAGAGTADASAAGTGDAPAIRRTSSIPQVVTKTWSLFEASAIHPSECSLLRIMSALPKSFSCLRTSTMETIWRGLPPATSWSLARTW